MDDCKRPHSMNWLAYIGMPSYWPHIFGNSISLALSYVKKPTSANIATEGWIGTRLPREFGLRLAQLLELTPTAQKRISVMVV
jgi:hypothetical protein